MRNFLRLPQLVLFVLPSIQSSILGGWWKKTQQDMTTLFSHPSRSYQCLVRPNNDGEHYLEIPEKEIHIIIESQNLLHPQEGSSISFLFESQAKNTSIRGVMSPHGGGKEGWYLHDLEVERISMDWSCIEWKYIKMFYQIQKKQLYFVLQDVHHQEIRDRHQFFSSLYFYVLPVLKTGNHLHQYPHLKFVPMMNQK